MALSFEISWKSQFKGAFEDLAKKLSPANRCSKIAEAMKWSFQKDEVAKIFDAIERQKSMFGLALQNDHM